MIYPNQAEYEKLACEYDVVPVYGESLADMETPVTVLERFKDRPNVFLFESMEGGETWGRYSFIGVDPELCLEVGHGAGAKPGLAGLRDFYAGVRVARMAGLPRFCGGVVGFLGYEAVREFERMPDPKAGTNNVIARSRFMRADRVIVFDNVRHTIKIVVCTRPGEEGAAGACYERAVSDIARIREVLDSPCSHETTTFEGAIEFGSNMTRAEFGAMVRKAKEYIVAGDIIQAVLSQRFSVQASIPTFQLYRALRLLNPSPYTFSLKIGEQTLVGSSPEVMVRLTDNKVELRPIAGTRPRGATEQEDRALADELLSDEKEKAEHVMLVDLGRNDLGRVSETGSVQVSEYMTIERYSHVMHIVSHIMGVLKAGTDAYDVIRATFPAGTLSGAPKIRAMEIIHELEPGPRGAYGGAVGYIGYDGNMDLAITIRTLDVVGDTIAVQAGAGIVYDSDPDREFEETCHKARGMQKAVELAARGLEPGPGTV